MKVGETLLIIISNAYMYNMKLRFRLIMFEKASFMIMIKVFCNSLITLKIQMSLIILRFMNRLNQFPCNFPVWKLTFEMKILSK